MSEDLITNVNKTGETDSTPEFAKRLREARESKGLSMEEVADRLNLSASILEGLEMGDFNRLPSAGFVRGHIRSYAQVLDLDAEELISDFDTRAPDEQNLERMTELYASVEKHESRTPWIMIAVVSLLGLLLLLWGALRQNERETLRETPQHEEEGHMMPRKFVPEQTVRSQLQPAVGRPGAKDEPGDPVVEEALAPDEPGDPVVKKALAHDLLVLRTNSRTWVEVYGANGERLLFDMLTGKKSPARVRGRAPFRVVLGNSTDVTVELDGQRSDQTRFNRPSKTAPFIVDASGNLRRPETPPDR